MYFIWDAKCPYCNNGLKRIPKSKTRCPSCGNFIYIRTTINGQKFAVTEYEKNRVDNIRRRSNNSCCSSSLGRMAFKSATKGVVKGCSSGCLFSFFYFLLNL